MCYFATYDINTKCTYEDAFILGADITDYFNYGFTEETWRVYCEKQKKMRSEIQLLNHSVCVQLFLCYAFALSCGHDSFGNMFH